MEISKNNEIKNKLTSLQQSTKKGLQILTRETALQSSIGPTDLHISTGHTGSLEFTGNELKSLDRNILKLPDTTLTNLILNGGSQFKIKQNTFILNAVIKYIRIKSI